MIKLFSAIDKVYTSNGDVVLKPTKARVYNADNGEYYLELTSDTEYTDYLKPNNIIVAPTPQGEQAFRIKTVTKKSNRIDVKAYHVYYDSDNYIIADSYAVNMTCAQALDHFNNATDVTSPFATGSNITNTYSMRCVRKSLKECINDILERWGGHLIRDNFNIIIKDSIGNDNGITIEYKKNLQELTAEYDFTNVCTKVLPVGKDGALLPSLYVVSDTQYAIPYTKVVSFTQNIDAKDYPTQEEYEQAIQEDLLAQATDYLATYSVPVINYTLKGKPDRVADIGDYIRVKDKRIGVDVLTQVISYEYDAIRGVYVSLEFGNFTTDLSDLISIINNDTINTVNATVNSAVAGKQDTLTAGANITLQNNVISAVNTTYTAGANISINNNVISAEVIEYIAGNGINITSNNEIEIAPTTSLTQTYTVCAYKRSDTLYFDLVLPAPDYEQELTIQRLYIEVFTDYATNAYDTATIVNNGASQGNYNAYVNSVYKNLMQIAIEDTSGIISALTDGAYIIIADITLTT